MEKLYVHYEAQLVGELKRDENLVLSFKYDQDWLNSSNNFPLSLAMPLSEEVFSNAITLSFFENLMPEGEVRHHLEQTTDIKQPFEFLKEFGRDCAGAITLSQEEKSHYETQEKLELIKLNKEKIYKAIETKQSVIDVIAEEEPGYLSLAGAQDKFAAIYKDGEFFLPNNGSPTTHIVKVPIHRQGVKESVYNEYYSMSLAKKIGFNIPKVQVLDEDFPLYIIDRYDRYHDDKGLVHRIHQQDFCQALGIISDLKYEKKGGPSLKDNYELILDHVPAKKRLESIYSFFDWICFNLIIGNNDSHSKNISFLLREGKNELSPMYDLLCTSIYPKLKRNFSFKIGDRDDSNRIGPNQFALLEEELGLKTGFMTKRLSKIATGIEKHRRELADQTKDELPNCKIAHRISEEIESRLKGFKRQGVSF